MKIGEFIRDSAGAESVRVEDKNLLSGGAIQENRALTVFIQGGEFNGEHELVLRAEAPATIAESRPLDQQFAILQAVKTAGVNVPKPLWYCGDNTVTGKPFYLMQRIYGEALGVRVTRMGKQPGIAAELAAELAKIHTITPPAESLSFLEDVRSTPAIDAIHKYQAYLDDLPEPHPPLEWTLRWLQINAPARDEIVLCHRDFRTGNYMVNDGKVSGILDWEFSGWGDPHEDVAWFCARCWRFSAPQMEAGGIATRDVFYDAYERASGRTLNRSLIHYWETMAHARWAVIALQQTMRHRSNVEPSLELALIGRRVAELEYECLKLTEAL